MRILAIETVDTTGSVAALDDNRAVFERALPSHQRSAQSLAPAIRDLLADAGWSPADVQLIAVATGPGSFTGLRIGVTTAKTLAYGLCCEVIGVHTLQAIASRAPADAPPWLSVILGAGRGELFAADFRRDAAGHCAAEGATRTLPIAQWLESVQPGHVTGPGVDLVPPADLAARSLVALDRSLWAPTALAVGQLARDRYRQGHRDTPFDLVPQYFRRTAAEEQWERKRSPIANS